MKLPSKMAVILCLVLFSILPVHTQPAPISDIAGRLSEDDRVFGEKQVEDMVFDRPRMAEFAKKGDPLWTWAVEQFAGASSGVRYKWNSDPGSEMSKHFLATHKEPTAHEAGWISVRELDGEGYYQSGERMWVEAVFELYNLRNDPMFQYLRQKAVNGDLSKEQFERSILQCEYDAARNVGLFYKAIVEPFAEKTGLKVHAAYWHINLPGTFDEWFSEITTRGPYSRFRPYGDAYDKLVAPRAKHN